MEILTSLHNSLQPHWTSSILCRNIVNLASHGRLQQFLEGLKISFKGYDNKVKLRILLSFLGVKSDIILNHAVIIKQILEHASDSKQYDSWVTNIAGLVHMKLFPNTTSHAIAEPIEQAVTLGFQEICDGIMRNISTYEEEQCSKEDSEMMMILGDDSRYFQSMESLYTHTEMKFEDNTNPHFTYTGQHPNFLEREKMRVAEQTTKAKRAFALADAVHLRSVPENRLFSSSLNSSMSNKPRVPLSSGLGIVHQPQQRKGQMQKLDFAQVSQIEESKAAVVNVLSGKIESSKDTQTKKKQKVDAEGPSTEKLLTSKEGDNVPTNSTQAALELPQSSEAVPTARTSLGTSDQIKAPDLDTLFLESPLLSQDDQNIIRNFFSDSFVSFPNGASEMKFNLQRNERVNDAGEAIIEMIKLRLTSTPKNWQKVRTTKAKDKQKIS